MAFGDWQELLAAFFNLAEHRALAEAGSAEFGRVDAFVFGFVSKRLFAATRKPNTDGFFFFRFTMHLLNESVFEGCRPYRPSRDGPPTSRRGLRSLALA